MTVVDEGGGGGGEVPGACKNLISKSDQRSVSKEEENENWRMFLILTDLGRMYCIQPVWQICCVTIVTVRHGWL